MGSEAIEDDATPTLAEVADAAPANAVKVIKIAAQTAPASRMLILPPAGLPCGGRASIPGAAYRPSESRTHPLANNVSLTNR